MIIPNELWIGEPKHEDLINEYLNTDFFLDGEEEEMIAKLVKELKDEPLILEFLEIY